MFCVVWCTFSETTQCFVLFGVPSLRPCDVLCCLVYLLWDHTMFCVVWCTFSETTHCFVLFGVPYLRPHHVLCCLVYLLWDHTMFYVVWCTFSETTHCFVLFGVPYLRPHHVLCCLVYLIWDHTMFCVVWCTFSETTHCFVLFGVPSLRPHHVLCCLVYLIWDHTMFYVVWCSFSGTTQWSTKTLSTASSLNVFVVLLREPVMTYCQTLQKNFHRHANHYSFCFIITPFNHLNLNLCSMWAKWILEIKQNFEKIILSFHHIYLGCISKSLSISKIKNLCFSFLHSVKF